MANTSPKRLESLISELLHAVGLAQSQAETVARVLVETDMRGTSSHGVVLLPHYIDRIQNGTIRADADIRVTSLTAASAKIDASGAMGQVAMTLAADEAIGMARESGSGSVAVCDMNHCGALPSYGFRIASQGMIGVILTHTEAVMLPFGSRESFLGTNPLCVTIPRASGQTVCLDIATSSIAWNRIVKSRLSGDPIPSGCAVDINGDDTTDANQVHALRSFGGHKGSGLSMMIDLLCAGLCGAAFGPDLPAMYDMSAHRRLGGIVFALDIAPFVNTDQWCERIEEYMARLAKLKPESSGVAVLYPGQREEETMARCSAKGLVLPDDLVLKINRLAMDLGCKPLSVDV